VPPPTSLAEPEPTAFETTSEQRCYGGIQGFYRHASAAVGGSMKFSVYVPDSAKTKAAPALYYLPGLGCTEETFPTKAGAQKAACDLGLILVSCDSSPRHARYPGDDEHWDFGQGAGFYIDATRTPWSESYRMERYVTRDLMAVVEQHFPVVRDRRGILGHSMGGHGALSLGLKYPELYASISAFAPIVAPSRVPWGEKAFSRYLGDERALWSAHDATELVRAKPHPSTILIDQGSADKFLERELQPERFEQACTETGQLLSLRRQAGFDHSYYFVASFVAEHLRHHAAILEAALEPAPAPAPKG
jgi:S-formylglutathione hydrolase